MAKIHTKIRELRKKQNQSGRAGKWLLGTALLPLEVLRILDTFTHSLFGGAERGFDRFAEKDSDGVIVTSYAHYTRVRKTLRSSLFFGLPVFAASFALFLVANQSPLSVPTRSPEVKAATTYTVTNYADNGVGSLYEAITNSNATPGDLDTITFDGLSTTITPPAALPEITDAVTIDGDLDDDGVPDIELDGAAAGGNGLEIGADGVVVDGLIINNFAQNGIVIQGDNNSVISCYIGTNAAGTAAASNGTAGVYVTSSSSGNVIGGATSADRNVIAGNTSANVLLLGFNVESTTVRNNAIGVNEAEDATIGGGYGIASFAGADGHTIQDNVIGGATTAAILINDAVDQNTIERNFIGTDSTETNDLGNTQDGLAIVAGNNLVVTDNVFTNSGRYGINADDNDLGVYTTNTISNNAQGGATFVSSASVTFDANTITSNGTFGLQMAYVGTPTVINNNLSSNTGNGFMGINLGEGGTVQGNTMNNNTNAGYYMRDTGPASPVFELGGSGVGEPNTMDSNGVFGIHLDTAVQNVSIVNNTVTNNGSADADNGTGIRIEGSYSNTIVGNTITQNQVGLSLYNPNDSFASYSNVVGGALPADANTISQNLGSGVLISGFRATGNTVQGNTITSNFGHGIEGQDTHNIDAPTPEDGDNIIENNTISSNALNGILNQGASPKIIGNTIEQNSQNGIANLASYGSSTNPVTEDDDRLSNPIIGGVGEENDINGNALYGVYSLDTAPLNKSTVADDNNFDNDNDSGRVRQAWYGLVAAREDNSAKADATIKLYGDGASSPLAQFTTAGANGVGPASASVSDVETWQVIPEFAVSRTGTLQNFSPHVIVGTGSAGTAEFAFNGEEKAGYDAGLGNIDGRYQVALVTLDLTPNQVEGVVFEDINDNGVQESGEEGIGNVTVALRNVSNQVIDTEVTNSSGDYTFTNIPQGTYSVKMTVPSGYAGTTKNPSSSFTFASENETEQVNFGIAEITSGEALGNIRGTVYVDANNNAAQDSGEVGYEGITVRMYQGTPGESPVVSESDLLASSITNESGAFAFNNVSLGSYFVAFATPDGYGVTTGNNPSALQTLSSSGQTRTVNVGIATSGGVVTEPPEEETEPPTEPPTETPEEETEEPPSTTPETETPTEPETERGFLGGFFAGGGSGEAGPFGIALGAGALALTLANLATAVPLATLLSFLRLLLDLFLEPLLMLFGKKKYPWGTVFDSLKKSPITLASVRLYDANTNRRVATAISDFNGRFKFFLQGGKYKLSVDKPGFIFPSKVLGTLPKYEKKNLYFGEKVDISKGSETFDRDIPIDPPDSKGSVKIIVNAKLKQVIHAIVAFTGIAVALVNLVLYPSLLTFGLLVLHAVLLVVFWVLAMPKKPASWGRVYDQKTGKPVKGAVVRIYETQFRRLVDTEVANSRGAYGFFVGDASYYITVEAPGYDFPSKKKGKNDYVGKEFKRQSKDKTVRMNIPLVPKNKK